MKTKRIASLFLAMFGLLFAPVVLAQGTDTTPPYYIEKAPRVLAVGDGQVKLQWDVAVDNVAVTGYKIYYDTVSAKSQANSNLNGQPRYANVIRVDNINQTVVTDLTNDTKYYFAVTALDAAGNESEYYSPEAEATPSAAGGDLLSAANENINAINENTNTNVSNGNVNGEETNGNMNAKMRDEVSNLSAIEQNNMVVVSWTPASATAVDTILYISKDGGATYDAGTHVVGLTSYEVKPYESNTTYMFKMTTKDIDGNESGGVVTTLTTKATNILPILEDVTNLVATFEKVLAKYKVTLSWTLPLNVASIVSQVVYQSLDGTVFHQLTSLTSSSTSYQISDLTPGKYFFKLTTKDAAGNESAGVVKMVELPVTGPAIALVALLGIGTGWILRKRK